MDFPGASYSKESAHNAGDLGLIPGLGRSPGEGDCNTPISLPGESHGWTKEPGRPQSMGSQESDMTW